MADWWAYWWPVAIPTLAFLGAAVWAFIWLDGGDDE